MSHRFWLGLALLLALAGAGPPDNVPCNEANNGTDYVVMRDPTPEEVTQFTKDKVTLRRVSDRYKCNGTTWVVTVSTPFFEFQK